MSTNYQLTLDRLFAGQPVAIPRQELEAASRKTDPESSRRAAREIEQSGVLKGQRKICLELVNQYPGRASRELSQLGTLDRYQLARRLPEMVKENHLRVTQEGSEDQRWWVKT